MIFFREPTELEKTKPKFGLSGPVEIITWTKAEIIIRGEVILIFTICSTYQSTMQVVGLHFQMQTFCPIFL